MNKERPRDPSKKIKALRYGPFEELEKVGDIAYRLNVPSYMHIYWIVTVENLKHYEASMLDQGTDEQVLPIMEHLEQEAQAELTKDIVLHKEAKTTR